MYAQIEEYLGYIRKEYDGGIEFHYGGQVTNKTKGIYYSDEDLFNKLKSAAAMKYGESNIKLKEFEVFISEEYIGTYALGGSDYKRTYIVDADVYRIRTEPLPESLEASCDPLSRALNKALQDIKEGSRLALDVVRIANGDKEDFKDQIVEILLNEGYKVVAKDYLERLYQEQQDQQSGIYNDRTTVQENNFSAVGYYINVRKTETAIKVQVINVSTGEYEANVTINVD